MNARNVQFAQQISAQHFVDDTLVGAQDYVISFLEDGCMVMEELDVLHIELSDEGAGLA